MGLLILLLLIGGVIFVHSASSGPEDSFPSPLAKAHLLRIFVGCAVFAVFAFSDYRTWERWAPLLYWMGIGLLLFLLFIKVTEGGVVRWFKIGGVSVQPSEWAKLFTIFWLAKIFHSSQIQRSGTPILHPLLVVLLPFLLIAIQPDLGTALVFVPIALAILWVGGASLKLMGGMGLAGLVSAAVGYLFLLRDYQRDRLLVYIGRAGEDVATAQSYHVTHSMISIGSGGPSGKGLFLGTHSDLGYLPEDHNDFIFGVIGEEWGLIGTLATVAIFMSLYLICLRVAWNTREPFGRLAVVGITAQLAFQTMVNLGMTVGLVPVTGLPLPLVSYGGTSMYIVMAGLGFIFSVARQPVASLHPDGLLAGTSSPQHRP